MKKLMAFLMVLTMLCGGAMAASAAEGDLVESPTDGASAGVVTTVTETTTAAETTTTVTTAAETVQTGDNAPLAIVGTLAVLGLAGAGIAVAKRKKEE